MWCPGRSVCGPQCARALRRTAHGAWINGLVHQPSQRPYLMVTLRERLHEFIVLALVDIAFATTEAGS